MIIKFIDCTETYHKDVDEIVNFLSNYFESHGIKNYRLKFSELRIAKCSLCRHCTQEEGEDPVKCVIRDDLNDTIDKIEEADAYVILADRNNLFIKNKIHEKLVERLVAYHYWPYGQSHSIPRRITLNKTSILINYNTTKYFMNHTFYTSKKYMTQASSSIGAKVLDWLVVTPNDDFIKNYAKRLKEMADKLILTFEE